MKLICCLALVGLLLAPGLVVADCCKIPIPIPEKPINPNVIPEVPFEFKIKNYGELPTLGSYSERQMHKEVSRLKGKYWEEEKQQGVIAWNGKEQVMVLTTQEKSLVGKGAMLSLMPLPGRVKSVTEARYDTFERAKTLIHYKIGKPRALSALILEAKIGAHNISVFQVVDPKDPAAKITPEMLTTQVKSYIIKKFGGKATALFTDDMIAVLKKYCDEGFHYFAFDLMEVSDVFSQKVAIRYHFETSYVYYPLVISQVGGTGDTSIDLVIFSPRELNRFSKKGLPESAIKYLTADDGKNLGTATKEELSELDKPMGALFPDGASIRVRNFLINGKLDGFKADLKVLSE